MRLNFRKVSAIATSVLMVGMTMGVAAAANYPLPFTAGSGNVAIVYGTGSGVSALDVVSAGNIMGNLQSKMSGTSVSSSSVSGEAADLGTDGTRIYIADSINKVKSILTKSDLPTLLADGSFSGNVDATYYQTVEVGAFPNITFAKQPTSSDDPNLGLKLSTSTNSQAYNLTVSFSKVVNFTHPDSEGQDIVLFGKSYTVSSSTDATNLVLFQSASKISLSSLSPSADVTVGGKTYTIELVSAADTSATVSVTDKATGIIESKEVEEAKSKKINGISVAVATSDENNLKYSAQIVVGTEKVTLTDGSNVRIGETDTAILGTSVNFNGGTPTIGISKISISIAAADSEHDALKAGDVLVDPVFKTIKLGLAGFNIDATSALREDIKVEAESDNKLQVTFTDYLGQTRTQKYAMYEEGGVNNSLYVDEDYHNLSVREGENLHKDDFVMVGNEDEGHLLRVSSVFRGISGGTTASGDYLKFMDEMSKAELTATLTANTSTKSTGTIDIGGKRYSVVLAGTPGIEADLYNVTIDYPDSSGEDMIVYPTISTSKGAKLAFYEPINVSYGFWGGDAGNLTGILVPNGAKTYQDIGITPYNSSGLTVTNDAVNITCTGGGGVDINTTQKVTCPLTNTGFTYQITYNWVTAGATTFSIELMDVAGTTAITDPAIMIFEGLDDNSKYEGLIVTTDVGSSSEDGAGVADVQRTWLDDGLWDEVALASNNKMLQEMDLWGTIITTDNTDADQREVTISYPKQQVYALAYVGAADSSISGGTAGGGTALGDILVKDSEVSSVSSKNLVVVGGSCINSAAATLLGGAYCGSAFTDKTGIGSGQFLIQSFGDAYTSGRIALLVAGYEATETKWAADYLKTQAVDTTAGKKYQGTSATTAELVVA